MHVVCKRLYAVREFHRIGDDISRTVAADLPAVIDHDKLVAGVFHSAGYHRIRGFANDSIVDPFAGKLIPTVPAHRRRLRQLLEFLGPGLRTHCHKNKKGDAT